MNSRRWDRNNIGSLVGVRSMFDMGWKSRIVGVGNRRFGVVVGIIMVLMDNYTASSITVDYIKFNYKFSFIMDNSKLNIMNNSSFPMSNYPMPLSYSYPSPWSIVAQASLQ